MDDIQSFNLSTIKTWTASVRTLELLPEPKLACEFHPKFIQIISIINLFIKNMQIYIHNFANLNQLQKYGNWNTKTVNEITRNRHRSYGHELEHSWIRSSSWRRAQLRPSDLPRSSLRPRCPRRSNPATASTHPQPQPQTPIQSGWASRVSFYDAYAKTKWRATSRRRREEPSPMESTSGQ